jgi:eukaryotic-like serine/threonine-protein kinase
MNELGQEQVVNTGDVLQQFKMIRSLGAGFHGEVWLAEHLHTGAPFAFKFMHLEDSKDAKKVRRALETAKGTYRIEHANVIKVHDLGCEPSGMVWLRMDYLEGKSVAELLRQGSLSLLVALDIAIEVAWGLDAAHELGIIHRDIKPDNVFMTKAGVIIVLDFSIAKVIPAGIRTTVRKTGMGTAPYMAPDNLRGAEPDARFDVYALGIMLWEMIAGYHPFHDALRDTEELIRRQLHVDPAPLSVVAKVPAEVDKLVRRATAKDPAARFFTIAEMAQAMIALKAWLLAEVAANRLVLAKRRGEPTVNSPLGRRDYRRDAAPEPTPAPPMPTARVVVAAAPLRNDGAASGPIPLPQTLPLPEAMGPGGTLPFGSNLLALAQQQRATAGGGQRDTALLPLEPSPSISRETPTPTADPSGAQDPASTVSPKRPTLPTWLPLVLLALIVGLVTGVVVFRSMARRPPPLVLAPAASGLPSASPPTPPLAAPEAPPSVEPAPSAAPALPAPIASTAPKPALPHPKPPSSRPPPATPAPTFRPLFELGK